MILNELKQKISNIINESQLSIDAVYFVIKDIFKEVEQLYYLELQKEKEEEKNKQESDK